MSISTREAYGQALAQLMSDDDRVVVLDADLGDSTKTALAKKVCPDRYYDMGIAECNMVNVAAGFAASGYIPFVSSFAIFLAGRAWEQIRNGIAYSKLNVKICATHAGISVGEDGATHQAIEDIALMRVIPNMEVYSPCDAHETMVVIKHIMNSQNPCYVRLGRNSVKDIYQEHDDIDVSKINILRHGKNIALCATGSMVQESIKAANILEKNGIKATVVDICCLKPLDEEGILRLLNEHEIIFTVEEHNVIGGLGAAIAEISNEKCPRIINRLGMEDEFGKSGKAMELLAKYHLDAQGIANHIKDMIL
ncbi:MAG: transketolase family protein [Erysipelotrichaceae bacterium]|nr:transketolase family protein [Erysipelotrichaceae bacterium]MDY5251433.1 transketolase family protein [Erysipelotrichaceae bacterium]